MRSNTLTLDALYPLSDETLAYGEAVTGALLGVDALYREESGDDVGLACLNMDTEGRYPPEDFASYAEARERFEELERQATFLPEVDRRVYYPELCASTLAFMDWREDGLLLRDQLSRFLRIPSEPVSDQELDVLRGEMQQLLGELGFTGELSQRCAEWERRNRVPTEAVEALLNEMLDAAWERANESLLPIPAEKSDGMRAQAVSGVAYNARCDYLARTIQINTDPVLTWAALRHLAAHEGCGGHYMQFKLREHYVAQGLAPADNLLSLVNSASSCIFEGIADAALEMMGLGDRDNDRFYYIMNRYRAGIVTLAAWRLHARNWSEAEVRSWLMDETLIGGEGWVDNRMGFITAPERACLIWSYWWGEPLVAEAWWKVPRERRREFLQYLYGRMHCNRSVSLFL